MGHLTCVDLPIPPTLRSQLTMRARSELAQSEQGVPSGALEKDILSFSERVLCGWDNSTLNCCSPERSHPEDKIKPRTWQGRQSQGSEPCRIIGSHCARSLPTSGIFLDCWSQVALISLSNWDVFPNHPGSMFVFYGDLWGSGLKVWELSWWCLECPG